ncbi:unnamed protein product [Symbiodinium sp. CCMP2592]|nr:unnamed protein product [Symbiodinium sp. CCMP2592]
MVPQGTIDWSADHSVQRSGWQICLRQPQEPQEVQFVLDGHCDSRVNGRYDLQGYDVNGRWMYALEETYFLYYSTDCDGEPHAWTISSSSYSCAARRAYVESNTELPPQSATWKILCYEPTKWTETTLTLSEETTLTTTMTATMTTTTRAGPANMSEYLVVQNSCRPWLSGVYELQGWSSSGLARPWYKYENSITPAAVYLWYDEQCGAAWYFKSSSPNDNSSNDPGGADSCNFYSRADSEAILPPDSGWQTWCTDSQIDLYPDQVSIAATAWFVSSGSCEFLPDSQCIATTGFPLVFYGSYDHCDIEVAENNILPIQVLAFEIGSKDKLMVNGQSYSGTHGPDDVVPQGIVEWRADRVEAASGHAWAICLGTSEHGQSQEPSDCCSEPANRIAPTIASSCDRLVKSPAPVPFFLLPERDTILSFG